MGSKTTVQAPPAPAPVNPGNATQDYLNAMTNPALQAQMFAAEQQYRPGYNQLNLQDMNQYLNGIGDTPGALELFRQSTEASSQIQGDANSYQRQRDIQDVANLGQQATAAFRNANPELQAQLSAAQGLSGGDPYAQFREQLLQGQPDFGNLTATPANASLLGSAPQATSQGYSAALQSPIAGVSANNISAGQVGAGALGESLYNRALGPEMGALGMALQGRAQGFAQSTGKLNPDELRSLQQSTREAYAARGTEMGSGSISAEALSRLTNERQRMQEDVGLAAALNAQGLAEVGQNRAFANQVQGADLARQSQNVAWNLGADQSNQQANLTASLANQGVAASQAGANQQALNQAGMFGAQAGNTASLANQAMAGQYGLANQQAENQFGLYNNQTDLATQEANRNFNFGQYQQNLGNLGILGQFNASQLGQDRNYALQLAQMQAAVASDPFAAILGRQSGALQYGAGQQGFAGNLTQSMQGPQLFDPNAGINLALQNTANQGNYQSSIFGAQAGVAGANAGAKGAMAGAGIGAAGAIGGALIIF